MKNLKQNILLVTILFLLTMIVASAAPAPNNAPSCTLIGTFEATLDLKTGDYKDDNFCIDGDSNDTISVISTDFNTSVVNINSIQPNNQTLAFNFTPLAIGNTIANITVSDGIHNTSFEVNLTVVTSNNKPSCTLIGTFDATLDLKTGDYKDDNFCIDGDSNDTISVISTGFNASVISIDSTQPNNQTLAFNFTPVARGQTIANITVSDGFDNTTFSVNITVMSTNQIPSCVGSSNATLDLQQNDFKSDNLCSDLDVNDTLSIITSLYNSSVVLLNVTQPDNQTLAFNFTSETIGNTVANITVSDGFDTDSFTVNITVIDNAPKTVGMISDINSSFIGNATIVENISQYFTDANDNTLNYSIVVDNNLSLTTQLNETSYNLSITPNIVGNYTVTIFASDNYTTVNQTFTVTVLNRVPTLTLSDATIRVSQVYTLDLNTQANDVDGQTLTYALLSNSNPGEVPCSVSGSTLSCDPDSITDIVLSISVTDGFATVNDSFTLDVTSTPSSGRSSSGGSTEIRVAPEETNETEEPVAEITTEPTEVNVGQNTTEQNNNGGVEQTTSNTQAESNETDANNAITAQFTGENNTGQFIGIIIGILFVLAILGFVFYTIRKKK